MLANEMPVLDRASNPKRKVTKKESWSCPDCGGTTTNPEDSLIEYAGMHMDCPGRKK